MAYRLNPTLAEFLRALKRPNTFNITKNRHIIFGLLLGLPIPILVLWLDLYLTGRGPVSLSAILERFALRPFHYLFLFVPFITGIILGAFGTIRRENDQRIQALIEQLETLSNMDPLTALYNRRYFDVEMEKEYQRASRGGESFSIVMFDVDNLKTLNDLDGHAAGSKVLKAIGRIAHANCRLYDVPARYGGDEFIFLLPNTTKEHAMAFARRLFDAVKKHDFNEDGVSGRSPVSISIGVAAYPDDAGGVHEVVECADAAMYVAKKGGRARIAAYEQPANEKSE
jgi:diguanylate cyclase (GGDEF)-like protein